MSPKKIRLKEDDSWMFELAVQMPRVTEKYCNISFFFSEVKNSLETLLWSSSDFSGEEECIEGGSECGTVKLSGLCFSIVADPKNIIKYMWAANTGFYLLIA